MKCAVGTDFRITYPFHGFPPMLPVPQATGLPHDFDAARMRDYLTRYATQDQLRRRHLLGRQEPDPVRRSTC